MTKLRLYDALGFLRNVPRISLRTAILLFASMLGAFGLWTAVPEFIRPRLPFFPATPADTKAFLRNPSSVARAAYLGYPRGDLWADYALTLAIDVDILATPPQEKLQTAYSVAAMAVRLAPLESRAWLVLADLASRSSINKQDGIGPLRMSLLTGPNMTDLIPRRLAVATQSDAIDNPEIQELVARDIRIVGRQSNGAALLANVYRRATTDGKAFIEQTIRQFDPEFSSRLRSNHQPK